MNSKVRFRTLTGHRHFASSLKAVELPTVMFSSIKFGALHCGIVRRKYCTIHGDYPVCFIVEFLIPYSTLISNLEFEHKMTCSKSTPLYCIVNRENFQTAPALAPSHPVSFLSFFTKALAQAHLSYFISARVLCNGHSP